jgi:Outer membrane cobalamin receptor protein
MKKFFSLIIMCFICLSSWGQDRNVIGTIVSERGIPVKNIKLSVVGLPNTAKTNKNGEFTLKNVRSEDSIVINVNKKAYAKFCLGENDSLKLVLSDKTIAFHNQNNLPTEDILVFYGTTSKSENIASSSVVTAKMIERMNALTIEDAIKGQMAGVDVNDGAVTMRGVKSFNMSNNALVIVDGMEMTSLPNISAHDVESIEAIKDGFGYGVKGACGVLIIKTKRGK